MLGEEIVNRFNGLSLLLHTWEMVSDRRAVASQPDGEPLNGSCDLSRSLITGLKPGVNER